MHNFNSSFIVLWMRNEWSLKHEPGGLAALDSDTLLSDVAGGSRGTGKRMLARIVVL